MTSKGSVDVTKEQGSHRERWSYCAMVSGGYLEVFVAG